MLGNARGSAATLCCVLHKSERSCTSISDNQFCDTWPGQLQPALHACIHVQCACNNRHDEAGNIILKSVIFKLWETRRDFSHFFLPFCFQTAVPFGLVISPLAETLPEESPPPIVNMGEMGPVRCIRCKAYMCPMMQFIDGGRRFHCLLCKATSEGKFVACWVKITILTMYIYSTARVFPALRPYRSTGWQIWKTRINAWNLWVCGYQGLLQSKYFNMDNLL